MDIDLKILLAKSKLVAIKWRLKLTREELEEKRPSATEFIKGASEVENELDAVNKIIDDLETELRINGREINRYLLINGELKKKIEELEHELKFKNIDL